MSTVIIAKLTAIFTVVAVGYLCGRTRMFSGEPAVRLLSNVAFYVFTPALLFRITATIDLADMPWVVIAVYFGPAVSLLLVVYAWQRWRAPSPVAGPSIRAISVTFGNTVQLGIPIVVGLFGDGGLAIYLAIVSLHAVTLLTVLTVLVELDLARSKQDDADGPRPGVAAVALTTARATVVHPVVLPVLVGLVWNVVGLPLPGIADDVLGTLGQAVVPLCLVLIGLSLAFYGVSGVAWPAVWLSAIKLVVLPALVLAAATATGLRGDQLQVVVLCGALPTGSNALLFAQRYRALEAETTASLVASTLAFVVTAPVWLLVLHALA